MRQVKKAGVLIGALAVLLSLTVAGAGGSSAASSLPFTDPNASGYIGFCNPSGQQVTSGSINAVPFVWTSVSTFLPPKSYLGNGQNAELNIYQARQGVDPGDWSGEQYSGATFFPNSNAPATQDTIGDPSLAQILKDYPPQWNGMYEIRMFFARANYGLYSNDYPATTIQVTGSTWHVIQGGPVNCKAAGHATSDEVIQGIEPSTPPGVKPTKNTSHASLVDPASSGPAAATGTPLPGEVANAPSGTPAAVVSSAKKSSSDSWVWYVIGAVALAGLAGAFAWRRQKTSASV